MNWFKDPVCFVLQTNFLRNNFLSKAIIEYLIQLYMNILYYILLFELLNLNNTWTLTNHVTVIDFIIFLNSTKLIIVWKKTFFKRHVSIILWSFSTFTITKVMLQLSRNIKLFFSSRTRIRRFKFNSSKNINSSFYRFIWFW